MNSPFFATPVTPKRRPSLIPSFVIRYLTRIWLNKISDNSSQEQLNQCLRKLNQHNRRSYSIKQRLSILNSLQLILNEHFYLRELQLPGHDRIDTDRSLITKTLDKLYEQFIIGYKILVMQISGKPSLDEDESIQLQEAIYFSLKFLSQRIMLAYSQYNAIPKGLWRECHQIFRYGEENNLFLHIVDDPVPDTNFPVFHTGDFVYKRLLLLALAEPYRLMQGECVELYKLCSRWANDAHLSYLRDLPPQGKHIVDMADDRPPRFVSSDLNWHPVQGRIIDITDVIMKIDRELEKNEPQSNIIQLYETPQIELMKRIRNSYQGKLARAYKRFRLASHVLFAPGVNACHYYLLNDKPYTPEMDELRLLSDTTENSNEQLDINQFSNQYEKALDKDRKLQNETYQLEQGLQRDVNPLGLSLIYHPPGEDNLINVGELVAHRTNSHKQSRWQIGITSWMHRVDNSDDDPTYQLGIKNIAKTAIPVAIKFNSSDLQAANYQRALLIPEKSSHDETRSLVLTSSKYDIDTELIVNMQEKLFSIRLKRILLDTRSFTQYEFDIVS